MSNLRSKVLQKKVERLIEQPIKKRKSSENSENLSPTNNNDENSNEDAANLLTSPKKFRLDQYVKRTGNIVLESTDRLKSSLPKYQSSEKKCGNETRNTPGSEILTLIEKTLSPRKVDASNSPNPGRSPGLFGNMFKSKIPVSDEKPKQHEMMLQSTVTSHGIPKSISSIVSLGSAGLRHPSVRKLRKSLLQSPFSDKIRGYFERAFSINEDKINELIVSKLKVRNKNDFKEKSDKQSKLITELKSAFKTIFVETDLLRDNCITTERNLNESIRVAHQELQEYAQFKAMMRNTESQVKRDYMRVSNELVKCTALLTKTQAMESTLRESLAASEKALQEQKERAAAEESSRQRADAELEWIRGELQGSRREAADALAAATLLSDQVLFRYAIK